MISETKPEFLDRFRFSFFISVGSSIFTPLHASNRSAIFMASLVRQISKSLDHFILPSDIIYFEFRRKCQLLPTGTGTGSSMSRAAQVAIAYMTRKSQWKTSNKHTALVASNKVPRLHEAILAINSF